MTCPKKPRRKKSSPEALLASLRRIDVAVGMTLRVDVARMHDAAARRYLSDKLRQIKKGTYKRPWWLSDDASSTGLE